MHGKIRCFLFILFISYILVSEAQQRSSDDYLKLRWKHVATQMPDEWYSSEEARTVAEKILITQKEIGGWEKNQPYHRLSKEKVEDFRKRKSGNGATFDNGATITELWFLAKMYKNNRNESYRKAFLEGLNYIFEAQYENGGWPQFYPVRERVTYTAYITYNDNAMINVMRLLEAVIENQGDLKSMNLEDATLEKAMSAFNKGVDCILKTQITIEGNPTVWCAQHHHETFEPAKARSYELPSFSGAESAGITLLLMDIDDPSAEVITAVNGAVKWFEEHQIEGIRVERRPNEDGKRDKFVVEDHNASPLWGRFYDLETETPYFCDRDGIKKDSLSEIGYERRIGYSWYTDDPAEVLDRYHSWRVQIGL